LRQREHKVDQQQGSHYIGVAALFADFDAVSGADAAPLVARD
jgi:hypothetical protein